MNEVEVGFVIGCKDIRMKCRAMHASRARHTRNISVLRNSSGEQQFNCFLHFRANSGHRKGIVHEMDFVHIWNVSLRTLNICELMQGSHKQHYEYYTQAPRSVTSQSMLPLSTPAKSSNCYSREKDLNSVVDRFRTSDTWQPYDN